MAINPEQIVSHFDSISDASLIEEGGQKWVYEVVDQEFDQILLKIYKPSQNFDRIKREIEAANNLVSEYVPEIYDFGTFNTEVGELFWAKEHLVEGNSLRDLLYEDILSKPELLTLLDNMLSILLDLENADLVHRDIKPGNIIRDPQQQFWLTDFGIVRHLELSSLTPDSAYWGPGTYGYASPEQFKNEKDKIDSRTDLFALGVVGYEVCMGNNPLQEDVSDRNDVIDNFNEKLPLKIEVDFDNKDLLLEFLKSLTHKYPDRRPKKVKEAKNWFKDIRDEI